MTTTDDRHPVEERLRAALRARADLVQPEDLGSTSAARPTPRRPRWYAVAAAAAVALAVPTAVVALQRDDAPPDFAVLGSDDVGIPFDIDGDGDSDVVTIAPDGTLTLDRGSDGDATVELPAGSRLLGVARFEAPSPPVSSDQDLTATEAVVAVPDGPTGWSLRMYDARGDERTQLLDPVPAFTETSTAWVSRGTLYAGHWEAADDTSATLRMETELYEWGVDGLGPRELAPFCWDRSAGKRPAPCDEAAGGDAVGPREPLPALFPAQSERLRPGDAPWTQQLSEVTTMTVRLEPRANGADLTLALGSGNPPRQLRVEGSDVAVVKASTWPGMVLVERRTARGVEAQVYGLAPGLRPIPTRSDVPLLDDSGFEPGQWTYWVSGEGILYSRRILDPAQGEVWRWQLTDVDGEPVLTSSSLGIVCFDLGSDPIRYARC